MTTRVVSRPARDTRPVERPEPRTLSAPPTLGDAPAGGLPLQSLLPVIGSMSSITMMVVLRGNPVMVIVGAMILVVALVGGVGMAMSSRGRQVRQRLRARELYLDYLERLRAELRDARERARAEAHVLDPRPAALPELVRNPGRVWERRPSDADFLRVRIGEAAVPWFGLSLPDDPNPIDPADPLMVAAGRRVCESHSAVPGMPLVVELAAASTVSIVGPREHGRAVARSLLAQVAAWHAPDDAAIGLVVEPSEVPHWDGVDLLPHVAVDGATDGPMPARRIGASVDELCAVMSEDLAARQAAATRRRTDGPASHGAVLVVEDYRGGAVPALAVPGIPLPARRLGLIHVALVEDRLDEPSTTDLRITVADDASVRVETLAGGKEAPVEGRPDLMDVRVLGALASALCPLRLSAESRVEGAAAGAVGPLELLGVDAVEQLAPERWTIRDGARFLRVPVGTDDRGQMLDLDLKEGAQGGMGPHGICIGATGSGKSEFLRTLVLGLAAQHSPEDLAMILVDYKGGAAFSPLAPLPHVSGLIDNLEGEAGLVERARASIAGEVVRRQRQLKEAGSLASITEYRRARATNPSLPPMPHLFVVIDEFGELLTAEPEFVDLLLTIGRIGRSIGVHMLLSSQRIESGKLRGLDTYLSYRIGLRTFSESESQVVLSTGDAFHLPPEPGWGYLKVDTTVYTRFRSGYVSGPTPGPVVHEEREEPTFAVELPPYNTLAQALAGVDHGVEPVLAPAHREVQPLIDEAVARLRPGVASVASVWLPPLPERLPLFSVLDRHGRHPLRVPVGLIDDPARQLQGPWSLDLDAAGGHHAVIGAPQSGRTTFLRAVAAGIATTHTPAQVTMYGLDLAGSGLARLEGFPHVGGVVTRHHTEQHMRLLEELHGMLAHRERLFRDLRIESLAHFRSLHTAGALGDVVSSDIVLLVDGYGLVRTDFEQLEAPLAELLTRGGSFGIHVVMSLTRWAEVALRHQPLIGNRYELRLNDATESTIGRKLAETIETPGRALTQDKLFAQVALPRFDDGPDDDAGEALSALAARTAADWRGPSAAPIRLLPESLDPAALPDPVDEPRRVPLGLRQDTMTPELLDFAGRDPHVLVLGDPGSGKSTVLRQILAGITERYAPDEVVLALMEPRGELAGTIGDDYLGGHATNGAQARELAAAVAVEMENRRDRKASSAMRVFVIADDFDILSAGGATPLQPLLPFLPQARDLGLTVILTRPVAGASRAMFDAAVQTMRDTGATGLVLSGERSEGALWPGLYANPAVPGRARIVRRAEPPRLMQVAHRVAVEVPVG
ncbi:type VII secretion protein EccCa [Demequina gelatinilytica]|uniref:type VII secretion protein EccCa n=1 Tax=Demequina gelatinilytica TaxID=1638980 RepID=UPI000782DE0D|nr:type VII secretion protein EccCa [Demequina gelatinilytica]